MHTWLFVVGLLWDNRTSLCTIYPKVDVLGSLAKSIKLCAVVISRVYNEERVSNAP